MARPREMPFSSYCTLVLQAIHEENRAVRGGRWKVVAKEAPKAK